MLPEDEGRDAALHTIARLQEQLGEERRLRQVAERAHELLREELAKALMERDFLRRAIDEVADV